MTTEQMIFPKNASEQVRVFRENYKGHDLINARVFFRDSTEEWKPAKKGLALSPKLARQVAEAMLALCDCEGSE